MHSEIPALGTADNRGDAPPKQCPLRNSSRNSDYCAILIRSFRFGKFLCSITTMHFEFVIYENNKTKYHDSNIKK